MHKEKNSKKPKPKKWRKAEANHSIEPFSDFINDLRTLLMKPMTYL